MFFDVFARLAVPDDGKPLEWVLIQFGDGLFQLNLGCDRAFPVAKLTGLSRGQLKDLHGMLSQTLAGEPQAAVS